MSNIGKKHLTIAPSNSTSDNSYSSSNNQSVLRFDVGSSGMMIGQDVRLEFEIEFFKTDGATNIVMGDDYNLDPYLMFNSVIKSISWQSRRFNEKILERVNNYPLLCKHLISSLSSKEDLETHQFHESGCKGIDNNALTNKNIKFNGLVKSARKEIAETSTSVVLKLFTGITLSDPIDLDLTQGLTCEIVLANASEVIKGATALAGTGGSYIIRNPKLHIPILLKDDATLQAERSQPTQVLSFLSYSNIFDTLDSTDATIVHRLGLKNVINVLISACPTKYLQNYSEYSQGFYNAGIQKLTFFRNSQQYPLTYVLETDAIRNVKEQDQATNYPELVWNYLSAFRPTSEINKTSLTPANISGGVQVLDAGALANVSVRKANVERQGLSAFALGVSFDESSNFGIDTTNDNISYNIQSTLEDPDDNRLTTSYALNFFYLNRNDIVINQQDGIVSMSVSN